MHECVACIHGGIVAFVTCFTGVGGWKVLSWCVWVLKGPLSVMYFKYFAHIFCHSINNTLLVTRWCICTNLLHWFQRSLGGHFKLCKKKKKEEQGVWLNLHWCAMFNPWKGKWDILNIVPLFHYFSENSNVSFFSFVLLDFNSKCFILLSL